MGFRTVAPKQSTPRRQMSSAINSDSASLMDLIGLVCFVFFFLSLIYVIVWMVLQLRKLVCIFFVYFVIRTI